MASLTNRYTATLGVIVAGERKKIAPGATLEVDGRQDWENHRFVRAGWLELSGNKGKGGRPPKSEEATEGEAE